LTTIIMTPAQPIRRNCLYAEMNICIGETMGDGTIRWEVLPQHTDRIRSAWITSGNWSQMLKAIKK